MFRLSRRFQNIHQFQNWYSNINHIRELVQHLRKYEERDYDFSVQDIKNIKVSQSEELIQGKWKITWVIELLIFSYLIFKELFWKIISSTTSQMFMMHCLL